MGTFHFADDGDDLADVAKGVQQAASFVRAVVRGLDGIGVELSRDELGGMERVCGLIAEDLGTLAARLPVGDAACADDTA